MLSELAKAAVTGRTAVLVLEPRGHTLPDRPPVVAQQLLRFVRHDR
jgi:hypothetical protein